MEAANETFLTHECIRLACKFNGPGPCERNQERATLLEKEHGKHWLGLLHHCVECRGRELKEIDMSATLNGKNMDSLAESGKEKVELLRVIDALIKKQGFAVYSTLAAAMGLEIYQVRYQVQKLAKEGAVIITPGETPRTAVRITLSRPGAIPQTAKAKLAETAPNKPALPGTPQAEELALPGTTHPQAPSLSVPRLCNIHHLPWKYNRLGTGMGGCEVCISERSQANKLKFKNTRTKLAFLEQENRDLKEKLPAGAVVLDLAKYPEIASWLQECLAESMRADLATEIAYWLRKMMRLAGNERQ